MNCCAGASNVSSTKTIQTFVVLFFWHIQIVQEVIFDFLGYSNKSSRYDELLSTNKCQNFMAANKRMNA